MPVSWPLLTHYWSEPISHTGRNRGKPRTKGNPCKAGNVQRTRLSGLTDHLLSVSLTSPWKSWCVPVPMTKCCLQDLPQQDSSHSWLQRLSPPSPWDLGPGVQVSYVVLVKSIIIAILASKALMSGWYLELRKEKGRGGEREGLTVSKWWKV